MDVQFLDCLIVIHSYGTELPEQFPEEITAAEFAALTGLGTDIGRMALKVFCRFGLAEETGQTGTARVYALAPHAR